MDDIPEEYRESKGMFIGIYWHPESGYNVVVRYNMKEMLEDNKGRESCDYKLKSEIFQNVNPKFMGKCHDLTKKLDPTAPRKITLDEILKA